MQLYTCHASFESSSGHRYDKGDTIDLIDYKNLTVTDRAYFDPADQDHMFPIELAI